MATQENITVKNPFFVDNTSNTLRVIEKGQKKQNEELAHLGVVLQLVEKEVAEAKSGAAAKEETVQNGEKIVSLQTGNTNPSEGPSNNQFEAAMDAMILALQMLQILIAKYGNKKAEQQVIISQAMVTEAKNNLDNVIKNLKKIEKQQKDQKKTSTWEKVGQGILGGLEIVVGALTENPELVIMGIMSEVQACGGFQAFQKYVLVPILEGCGASKSEAEAIAPWWMCAMVITGSIASANILEIGAESVEVGTEVAETVSEDATDAAEESLESAESSASETESVAQKSTSFGRKALNFAKKVNQALGPTGRMALMSTMTMLSNTQAVQETYNYFAKMDGVSAKEREKIEERIGIAIAVVAFVVTISTSFGAATSGSTGNLLNLSTTSIKLLRAGLIVGTGLGVLGSSAAQCYEGSVTLKDGHLRKALADDQAALDLLNVLLEMNASETSSDQKLQADVEKNKQLGNLSLSQLTKGYAGFANVAGYNSPV